MKANKKTMLGVAFAVAVIALAGVGYALNYQGTTSSSSNTVKNSYVTVSLANYGAQEISGIYYNTVNTSGTITYELIGTQEFTLNTITVAKQNIQESEWTVKVEFASTPAVAGATITWDLGSQTNKTTAQLASGVTLGAGNHVLKLILTSDGSTDNESVDTTVTIPAFTVTVSGSTGA